MTLLRCPAQTSYFGGDIEGVLLSQGAGYGIVVGFGFFFVFLTIALVYGDYRARGGRHYNSEDFNTAGAPRAAGSCTQCAELTPAVSAMQQAPVDMIRSALLCAFLPMCSRKLCTAGPSLSTACYCCLRLANETSAERPRAHPTAMQQPGKG